MREPKIRKSGFYQDEEIELLHFCLSDDYPRSITVERTGTRYTVGHPAAARHLWRRLRGIRGSVRPRSDEWFHNLEQDRLVMEANERKSEATGTSI